MNYLIEFWRGLSGRLKLLVYLFTLLGIFLLYLVLTKPKIDRLMKKTGLKVSTIYNEIVRWLTVNTNISDRSARWIAAQSIHETGGFASDICKENKNLFGMKQPSKRQTLVIGTNRGHAVYKTYEGSLKDFVYYLQEFKNNPDDQASLGNWIYRLKNQMYFEDNVINYYKGVRNALDAAAYKKEIEIVSAAQNIPIAQTVSRGWSVAVKFLTGLNVSL